MHLFIDTNIFLSFYHFSSDDLEELKKLIVLLKQKKLTLYLPDQVISEFNRNRDIKIADALKKLKEQRFGLQFPQICKDYTEYSKLRALQKEYDSIHARLIDNLTKDIKDYRLKADEIIEQLVRLAKTIDCRGEITEKARIKYDLGNPPGKNDSLGDAVNWIALLTTVPEKVDLHFITEDKDYYSPLNEEEFNAFLLNEWRGEKKSSIIFYKRLSGFFKDKFPDIKLATELEKDILISDLSSSANFAQTHIAVAKLSRHSDFTTVQLNAIANAATMNPQIYWIIHDADVYAFLSNIIKGKEELIDKITLLELQRRLDLIEKPYVADADLPF